MIITPRMLEQHGACKDELDIFTDEWPKGVKVTEESCLGAVELRLDIDWVAESFFPNTHWEAYRKAIASHREAYHEAYIKSKAIEFAKQAALI